MIAVRVEGVVKRFGSTVALDQVSLTVEPGELFFLLGPSGCGKTTLLRGIAGFNTPDEGSIYFGDKDVTRVEPHKRNTGMMFQSYALWPHLTVEQNVAFGLEQRKLPKEEIKRRTREALESVQMGDLAARKPNQLSGGQQQRVALARALVVRPSCLLLDEPLSNLDAKLRHEMRQEIRRVCKEFSLTTIYVTHDQKEALSVADRVAVLDKGKLLQVGTPREIYRRPKTRFIADFIGETNFVTGTVIGVGGGMAVVSTEAGEFHGLLADPENEPAEGTKVTVSMRPECFRLDQYPADENCLYGRIGEAVYYGEVAQYTFQQESGFSLKIFELNPRFASDSGSELYAWIDPEDVVILTA